MRINSRKISDLRTLIDQSKTITILSHYNPDGDAVGSCAAMYRFLHDDMGKDAFVILPNAIKRNISFVLDDIEDHTIAESDFKKAKQRLQQTDLLFIMDMNKLSRAGDNLYKILSTLDCPKVMIDHHVEPEKTDLVFSDPHCSSCCELVYRVLNRLTKRKIFSQPLSTALYLGIITDTGSLSYSNDRSEVYTVLSELIKSGIKASKIHQKISNAYSFDNMRLLGYCISKKMRIYPKQRAAFIYLSKEELKRFNYQIGDLENVVNYCLMLEEVDFGALVTEREENIRMSFRSKDASINVNVFANKYWNGGGHVMAAGGRSTESLENVVKKLEQQIEEKKFLGL